MEANPGDIVYSKAGRDKLSYFVIMSVEGDYAKICDGRKRKIDRPKLKKLKHLRLEAGHSEYVAKKLSSGEKVTNAELRRALNEFETAITEAEISTENAKAALSVENAESALSVEIISEREC